MMRKIIKTTLLFLACGALLCAVTPWCAAAETNLFRNSGFESGTAEGWRMWQSTSVDTVSAYEGDYGAHLKGNGSWGALLEQDIALTVGQEYHLEFWYKVNSNGVNWKLVKGDGSGNYAANWVQHTAWTKVSLDFTATTDRMTFNCSGGGNGKPEDVYVDAFLLTEKKAAVAGELQNGSFEEGDKGWSLSGNCAVVEGDAYDGTHAVRLDHNQTWAEALTQTLPVEKNTDYTLTFYTKRVSGSGAWNLCLMDGNKTVQLPMIGENWFKHNVTHDWERVQVEFNSAQYDSLFIKIQPESTTSGVFLLDYMTLTKKGEQPDEPAIPPTAQPYMTSYGVVINRPAYPESNRLTGADFEEGTFGFDHSAITVVEDDTAPNGNKSLYFHPDREHVKEIVWVEVEPNTEYVFSTWLKGAFISPENPRYNATVGIVNEKGTFLSMSEWVFLNGERQIVPTAWDNAWHLRSIQFNSADATRVGICLSGSGSRLWLDDMALFRLSEGIKYMSENMLGAVRLRFESTVSGCLDQHNLLPDASFDSKDADGFWSAAHGWRNQTLTFVDSDYEYGTSLKYTASGRDSTMSTIKWIDVEPHTDYTFSMSLKILESGDGHLLLLDDKMREKIEFLYVSFDADVYDEGSAQNGWQQMTCSFNTDVYTRIGICVVDAGGEVLMDNMRLFKTEHADESVTDAYITPPAPSEPEQPSHPNTGDSRQVVWLATLLVALTTITAVLLKNKKQA